MELSQVTGVVAAVLTSKFAVIVCFGSVPNSLVLITHLKYREKLLRDTKDILTFSLTFGDFVMSAFLAPLPFTSAIAKNWTTGRNGCVIYGLFTTWIGLSSILQLSCIALERCYTLSSLNACRISRKSSVQIIAGCWLIAFLASSPPLFGFSQFTLEGYGLHCSIVWKNSHIWYCMFLLLFFYALPITTIAISYAKIFLVVHKVYRNAEIIWGSNAHVTRQSYTSQMKFTKQLVVVTCGFLIAWTPYAVMSTTRVVIDIKFKNTWYFEHPALFAKTANIYNSVIYFFMYRRLRRHVSMIFIL